jgi:hypothetical protein
VDKIQKDFINFKNEISTKLMDVIGVNNELFIVEKKVERIEKLLKDVVSILENIVEVMI